MNVRDQLAGHLEFFGELGVAGLRRDETWATRPVADAASAPRVRVDPDAPSTQHPAPSTVALGNQHPAPSTVALGTQHPAPSTVPPSQAAALVLLRADIGEACTRCKLATLGRQRIVFGVGHADADLMFVGEAPGADEDVQGIPFVGRAGQLLTKIIEAIGLTRDQVYIANVIKCRPPGNRNPEPDEVDTCEPFLFRQIDTIQPKVIVALGKFAAQSLLRTTEPITRLRGREYTYRNAVLMPTYHPAYLLRNPAAKRDVWEDMKRVKALIERP